jgi:hypothetical protein
MSGTAVNRGANPILTAIPGLAGTYAWPQIVVNPGGQIIQIRALSTITGSITINGVVGQTTLAINSASSGAQADLTVNRTSTGTANTLVAGANILLESSVSNGTVLQNSGGQTELWQSNGGVWNQILFVNSNRAIAINAPAGGVALTVNGVVGGDPHFLVNAASGSATDRGIQHVWSGHYNIFNTYNDGHFVLGYNGTAQIITGSAAGNVTIAAPTSAGVALSVSAISGSQSISVAGGPIEITNNALPCLAINSAGAHFGLIQNVSSTTWALGVGGLTSLGTSVLTWTDGGGVQIGSPTGGDQGAGTISVQSGYWTAFATYLMTSTVAWTAGATGNVPTLTAGPVNGNPTKWIGINDNGTVRHFPAW